LAVDATGMFRGASWQARACGGASSMLGERIFLLTYFWNLGAQLFALKIRAAQLSAIWKHGLMMFLLVSIWMRLERILMLLLMPFRAVASMESARSAIQYIAFNSPFVSPVRISSSHSPYILAPAHARRLS
jgi:hypothetical protein